MVVGDVPFQGSSDYQTFQMILDRQLNYPSDLEVSQEAKDLIDALLKVNPGERLGSGEAGSDNDFRALKNHAFFKDLDFDNVNKVTVDIKHKASEADQS